jgi:hypothetical protein
MYGEPFGGKVSGRYRISAKLLRQLARRRRLYADDIQLLSRAMLERGYILIDMETYFVVLSASNFANYRRASDDGAE